VLLSRAMRSIISDGITGGSMGATYRIGSTASSGGLLVGIAANTCKVSSGIPHARAILIKTSSATTGAQHWLWAPTAETERRPTAEANAAPQIRPIRRSIRIFTPA
jgi:hypothetical protein